MNKGRANIFILEITAFVSGALVMIYEIIGSRILSPYIGTSTYTWTSLIGVILAALSLGYWLGGKTADRKPHIKVLASSVFIAGGLVSVTILFKDSILSVIAANSLPLELKAVIAALILFAPASVFFGFVTPYAIKLSSKSLDDTGKTVGRLYALSTIGSIAGTFLAGFVLIPFVGSTRTLYFIAGILFLLSMLLAPLSLSRSNVAIIVVFVLGLTSNELQTYFFGQSFNFHDIDTQYNRVQIYDTKHKRDGKPIRAMRIDPSFFQSSMYINSDELTSEYAKFYNLAGHFKPGFKKTLMIGGAGYSYPKEYLRKYPAANLDVVEIDPQMTEIARRYFRLKDSPRLKIIHQDGRVFLNGIGNAGYDVILMDAFSTLFSVPFQLTTIEAVQNIFKALNKDGVVIFNLGGVIKGRGSDFLNAEINTYKKVFPKVQIFKVDPSKPDSAVQNIIIVARKRFATGNSLPVLPVYKDLLAREYLNFESSAIPVLTDDHAPAEYYNSFIQK